MRGALALSACSLYILISGSHSKAFMCIRRNSLGKEEGGSGVPLDREKYGESVAYWQKHAPIIAGSPSGE